MIKPLQLGDIAVDVVWKKIKDVHFSTYPPTGRVRISVPTRMSMDSIRRFAISKLDWIKQLHQKLREQERETSREYLDRESHYLWSRRYLLTVIESEQPVSVELSHSHIVLRMRSGTDHAKRQALLEEWYREQVKKAVPPLFAKWERLLGVKVEQCFVQRMKTKWGSGNADTRSIRLNTELAKKPRECLEYIVAHEMLQLLEPASSARIVALMDQHLPKWRYCRDLLTRLPMQEERAVE
ncbi:MAG: SprT family zinc-dependent metalloprotease [Verrucomicrobia bacterium]|nr:SprT family zinc-dependent metalloprotease [Verrucomicrobiota bacterium]